MHCGPMGAVGTDEPAVDVVVGSYVKCMIDDVDVVVGS